MRGALIGTVLLLLAGCGSGSDSDRLRVLVAGDSGGNKALAARLVTGATATPLLARDEAGHIVPGLASSWRFVDDGRSLILRIRPVPWSDRKPATAKQVAVALEEAMDAGGPVADFALGGIESVTAPTPRVVEVRLRAADPDIVGWLSLPEAAVLRRGATLGAYRAENGDGWPRRLVRDGREDRDDARSAAIEVALEPDVSAATAAFARGGSDIVMGAGLAGLAEARIAQPDALRLEGCWCVYGYVANTRTGPLADPRVRRALSMALDRDRVARGLGVAGVAVVTGLVPPSLAGPTPRLPDWAGLDLAARQAMAARLLKAAGYDPEHRLHMTLLLVAGRDHQAVAAAVGDDWRALGVSVTVSIVQTDELAAAVAHGRFDLALADRSVPVADAGALLRRFGCRANAVYCNPQADALLDAAYAQPPETRRETLGQAEAMMLADTPFVPLFTPVRWALVSPRVVGWLPNPSGAHPLGRLSIR